MAIAFMPVPSAVVRFPVELRAELSMDVIRAIEPDVREVALVAECLGLELPTPDLRDRVDAETARFIAEQMLPLPRGEQGHALRELLRPVVVAALQERSNARMMGAAGLLVVTHCRCQEAHGVSRAVGMARRGEGWEPHMAPEASAWLARAGRVVGGA